MDDLRRGLETAGFVKSCLAKDDGGSIGLEAGQDGLVKNRHLGLRKWTTYGCGKRDKCDGERDWKQQWE